MTSEVRKPADFGGGGITGSLDADGRIIALNGYHPEHGYVTLSSADPFPENERYDPPLVRAYRASLAGLSGFGLNFDEPILERETTLLESAVPHVRLTFANGAANVTTLANERGVVQIWNIEGVTPRWSGRICLQRCAYTQLTEGGPVPMPALKMDVSYADGLLTIENPELGAAVVMAGWSSDETQQYHTHKPLELSLGEGDSGRIVLAYGYGLTAAEAQENALWLADQDADALFDAELERWRSLWKDGNVPDEPMVRRGIAYGLMMAVPSHEGVCIITDHMLLPLHWNRDAYYVARALLSCGRADVVERHLRWMFDAAERSAGAWGRCYLANGYIKDAAFQLDQQLFPALEMIEYAIKVGSSSVYKQLKPIALSIIEDVLQRRNVARHLDDDIPFMTLFATDETPADDPIALPYHLSSHILFWRLLTLLGNGPLVGIGDGWTQGLANNIRLDIDRYFITKYQGKRIYAYATDGKGKHHFYHDANDIPLALAPAWGFVSADDEVWRNTIDFAFSEANVGGNYGGRLGSVHTRAPWPLGDVQDIIVARTIGDKEREEKARERLRKAAQWDGSLPEATDPETGAVISRYWFAWPGAALACVDLGAFGI